MYARLPWSRHVAKPVRSPILPPYPFHVRLVFKLVIHHRRRVLMPTARLTWTDPTTLTDGAPIPANDFADVEVFMSADGGLNYVNVGHAAPGAQTFDIELTDTGTFNFKLESKDTQTPSRVGPDSTVASVTVQPQPLAAINPPTGLAATIV